MSSSSTSFTRKYIPLVAKFTIPVIALLLIFNGLGPTPAVASTAGELALAIETEPNGLDPALEMDLNTFLIANQVFDTLLRIDPQSGAPAPGLAESWQVSPDRLTWTFTLRSGVSFHDGTPLDAAAVKFNFERWWDPNHPYHNGSFDYFESLNGGLKGDPGSYITNVSSSGNYTFTISLSQPFSAFSAMLTSPAFSIASPAAIQAGTLSAHPVGTGAFSFQEWVAGDHITLLKNTNYWAGAAQLTSLVLQVIPNDIDRFAALQSGTVQVAYDLEKSYLIALAPDPEFQLPSGPANYVGFLGINQGHPPLDNLLVRQAIAYAINQAWLVHQYFNIDAFAATQFLPPDIWGYNPNLATYGYNPAYARALLAQAGYPNGFQTTLSLRDTKRAYQTDPVGTANEIQNELMAIGIDATVNVLESSDFIGKVNDGSLDLFLLGWINDYPHPNNYFHPILCGDFASFGPLDEQLCDTVNSALVEPDPAVELALWQNAGQQVHDSLNLLPLAHGRTPIAARYDLAGISFSSIGEFYVSAYFVANQTVSLVPETSATLYASEPGISTTIQVPASAVTTTTELVYTPVDNLTVPDSRIYTGHAFTVNAYRDSSKLENFSFNQPVQVTIDYSPDEIGPADENSLALYYWDGSAWQDATQTCTPAVPIQRAPEDNQLTVSICHLSHFALFGESKTKLFLPSVVTKP